MSGGGGGGTQTVEQRSIPEWMRPYYEDLLIPAASQEFMGGQYTPYLGARVAGFSPGQQAAQQGIMGMTAPSGLAAAGDIFGTVGQAAMGQQYTPQQFGTGYQATPYESGFAPIAITSGYEAGTYSPGYRAGQIYRYADYYWV